MSFGFHRFDQNRNENFVTIFALKFFVASWGLPGSFWGLPGDLVSNIRNKEAYRKLQKLTGSPQEATKKIQGRNLYNIFDAIFLPMKSLKNHPQG